MSADMLARACECANELLGTAQSLRDVATEEEQNSSAFCAALDEHVMQCDGCGWWVEASEVDDDGNCEDCQE